MHASDPRPRRDELERLLAPIGVDAFLRDHADRRALLIKGTPEKFSHLGFDVDAFFAATQRLDPGGERLKAAGHSDGEAERYVPILPHQARPLFDAGLTVCAAGLSDASPPLAAMAEGVRLALSIPDLRFNAYLSPDGSGFNLHYDAQPIFLIQIAGAKRWWYGAEAITPLPQRYSSAWGEKPPLESLQQTVLEPGDVLYLPAFCWHRARARGFSLGITLGTKGAHNQPLRTAIEQSALFGPWPLGALQPPLDPAAVDPERVPEAALPFLEGQLAALRTFSGELTVEALWAHWVEQVQRPLGPLLPTVEDSVTSEDVLVRSREFPAHLTAADGEVMVRSAARMVRLPAECTELVRWVLGRTEAFTAREAFEAGTGNGLTRSESKRVLRELAALGTISRR